MKLKRLVASVSAGFEDFVAQVENHEAVADCMIEDVRHAAARVRVQTARVQSQITRLQRERADLDTERERWNARAVALAVTDEAKALECVRRSRQADTRLMAVEAQLSEHLRLADDLTSRLRELEERLNELQLRKTALSSRSARARSFKSTSAAGCEVVEGAFDRWEAAVLADEYRGEVVLTGPDSLEREFREQEETVELKARLEALKAASGGAS